MILGEVGLAGEVRRVSGLGRRLAEAARLGFTHAITPEHEDAIPAGMKVKTVTNLGDALNSLRTRSR